MEEIEKREGTNYWNIVTAYDKIDEIVGWINREEKARKENTDMCEWMRIQQLEQLGKIIEEMKKEDTNG